MRRAHFIIFFTLVLSFRSGNEDVGDESRCCETIEKRMAVEPADTITQVEPLSVLDDPRRERRRAENACPSQAEAQCRSSLELDRAATAPSASAPYPRVPLLKYAFSSGISINRKYAAKESNLEPTY